MIYHQRHLLEVWERARLHRWGSGSAATQSWHCRVRLALNQLSAAVLSPHVLSKGCQGLCPAEAAHDLEDRLPQEREGFLWVWVQNTAQCDLG